MTEVRILKGVFKGETGQVLRHYNEVPFASEPRPKAERFGHIVRVKSPVTQEHLDIVYFDDEVELIDQ